MKCTGCGAAVPRNGTCEYCGSYHREADERLEEPPAYGFALSTGGMEHRVAAKVGKDATAPRTKHFG